MRLTLQIGCNISLPLNNKYSFNPTTSSQHFTNPLSAAPPSSATELIGFLLVKRKPTGELLWGLIVKRKRIAKTNLPGHGYHN